MTDRVSTFALSILLAGAPAAALAEERPTEPFRKEHVEIKKHLGHLDAMIGKLGVQKPAEQKKTMSFIAKFLREHIIEHAEWEEAKLYPAVDKRVDQVGEHPFTESMRYEHKIVGRWIAELEKEQNPIVFARRADKLLGLIAGHFEEEEEVLLPILDKTMSKQDVEKELGLGS